MKTQLSRSGDPCGLCVTYWQSAGFMRCDEDRTSARYGKREAGKEDQLLNAVRTYSENTPVSGTVYGVALYAGERIENGVASSAKDVPSSPVMFLKPSNTHLANGGVVLLPSSTFAVEASATLAIIFGKDTRCASAHNALDGVAGYTLALDLTEEGAGLFRPPIREKCRDGFLPIGPVVTEKKGIRWLDEVRVGLEIDGREVAAFVVGEMLHQIAQTIEAVSEYMTLRRGDVLLAARTKLSAPVRAGSPIAAVSKELGRLECTLGLEEAAYQ